MTAKRNNTRKGSTTNKADTGSMFDFGKAFADYRNGHGAITAAAKAIAMGDFSSTGLYKALEADAKNAGEPLSKSRVVMSLRAIWSANRDEWGQAGKGLSIKDGEVTLKDLSTTQGANSGRNKNKDEKEADKANVKAGRSADKGGEGDGPVPVTSGDFDTTVAHLVALLKPMSPTQFNECRAKLAKALATVDIKIAD